MAADVWRFIGIPKVLCQICRAWFIEDTSRHPEFCSDTCYERFMDHDTETLPLEAI